MATTWWTIRKLIGVELGRSELSTKHQSEITNAGEGVLEARAALRNGALADKYPTEGLDFKLPAVHDGLDETVDRVFGLKSDHAATELERQDILFAS
jgi:hypothetical protein